MGSEIGSGVPFYAADVGCCRYRGPGAGEMAVGVGGLEGLGAVLVGDGGVAVGAGGFG